LLSDSLVVHKTGTMKNYHNSFLCYFGWEELEPIMISSTHIAALLLLASKWVRGSNLTVAKGYVALVNDIPGLLPKLSR
jgi:hypothetical protein